MTIENIQELELKDLPDAVVSELVKLAAIGAEVVQCVKDQDRMSYDEMVDLVEMNDFDHETGDAITAISWLETL
jgi:ACT domain-containing protein